MLRNLFALALVLTAGVAVAEESKPAAAAAKFDVAAYDTNKDGALSKEEIAAIADEAVKAQAVALDADKDGAVSATEAKASTKAAEAKAAH